MWRVAVAVAVGCTHAEPHALPHNAAHAQADPLCSVLDDVIAAGSDNFAGLVHADGTASRSTMVPRDAAEAWYRPCCASESAAFGPWSWAAEWPHAGVADFERFRARVLACDFAAGLVVQLRTATTITWELAADHVTIELDAERNNVEIDVAHE